MLLHGAVPQFGMKLLSEVLFKRGQCDAFIRTPRARKFRAVLQDSAFRIEFAEPYWNRYGVQGFYQFGRLGRRIFCISQSRSEDPDSPATLLRVFRMKT